MNRIVIYCFQWKNKDFTLMRRRFDWCMSEFLTHPVTTIMVKLDKGLKWRFLAQTLRNGEPDARRFFLAKSIK